LVQLAGAETDGADEKLPAAIGVLLEEPGEGRAAVTRDAHRVVRQGEADRLFGEEHRYLLALLDRTAANEESNDYPLGVLESRREVDHHLGCVWHLSSLIR